MTCGDGALTVYRRHSLAPGTGSAEERAVPGLPGGAEALHHAQGRPDPDGKRQGHPYYGVLPAVELPVPAVMRRVPGTEIVNNL